MVEMQIGLTLVLDGRFSIMLLDPVTMRMQGPDDDAEYKGYNKDELDLILSERYGMAPAEIIRFLDDKVANAAEP